MAEIGKADHQLSKNYYFIKRSYFVTTRVRNLFLSWAVSDAFCQRSQGVIGQFQKNPNRKGWGYTFLDPTPLEFFIFLLNPWKFQTKQSSTPGEIFHKIVLDPLPWKFQDQKQRPLEIPRYFFLATLGYSTSF